MGISTWRRAGKKEGKKMRRWEGRKSEFGKRKRKKVRR